MAIDFRLTSHQRALQVESRTFAADVLASARTAGLLVSYEPDQSHMPRDATTVRRGPHTAGSKAPLKRRNLQAKRGAASHLKPIRRLHSDGDP
jgi:hypothetical protein